MVTPERRPGWGWAPPPADAAASTFSAASQSSLVLRVSGSHCLFPVSCFLPLTSSLPWCCPAAGDAAEPHLQRGGDGPELLRLLGRLRL